MSVIIALCGSAGSIVPVAVPTIFWYVPTGPNVVPAKVGLWLGSAGSASELIVIVVMPVGGGGGVGAAPWSPAPERARRCRRNRRSR
jgi:hypothetical protein